MQMISPQTYREQNKDKSLNELIIKKEVLENDILNKEKILRNEMTSIIPIEDIDTFVKVSRLYLEELNRLIKEKQNISSENNNEFQPINEKVEDLTKQLAEAYRKNDESLIEKLQEKIKNQTRKQLEKNADIFVKEERKKQQEEIESKLDREKIKEQQKVIDDINKRIVANLVETWSMQTPEFKALRKELRIAISKMECYKNGIYDEDEIEQIYQDNLMKEKIILGKAYINRENLIDKIKYLSPGYDKRKEFSTINDFILAELKIIKEELLNTDGIEQSYIPCRRAKYCIEEFVKYINEDKLEESFYDIYEVIESDKYPHPLVDKGYEYSIYISNDEKSILLSMIDTLESKINNIEQSNSLVEKIDKKLKELNPNYEVPKPINDYKNNNEENHNVRELIKKVDEKIEKINNQISIEIFNKIKILPCNTEFTLQQFMSDYDITEEDKFFICRFVFDLCKNNNIVIIEKYPGADLGLPWNVPRIKGQ